MPARRCTAKSDFTGETEAKATRRLPTRVLPQAAQLERAGPRRCPPSVVRKSGAYGLVGAGVVEADGAWGAGAVEAGGAAGAEVCAPGWTFVSAGRTVLSMTAGAVLPVPWVDVPRLLNMTAAMIATTTNTMATITPVLRPLRLAGAVEAMSGRLSARYRSVPGLAVPGVWVPEWGGMYGSAIWMAPFDEVTSL